jgi:hypothetical protein
LYPVIGFGYWKDVLPYQRGIITGILLNLIFLLEVEEVYLAKEN